VGGVAQYNHSLVCNLALLGYRVTCLNPQPIDQQLIAHQQQLNIQHLWLDKETIEQLPNTLTNPSTRPDLIVCSNSNPFSNFDLKQIAIQIGIPYIVVEGLVEPHLAQYFNQYLDELSYHYIQSSAVIAVSYDNLNLLHEVFRLPQYKGQVIYYGRPAQYFTPPDLSVRKRLRQELGIPSDAVICFTAARIETRKGYQYQLKAISQLMHSPVWSQLYFVWAGAAFFDVQLESHLKAELRALGATEKIKFLGHISDVSGWLDVADIFVFPSQLEGMPLCVMEAMAKGLPVIATSVSGIPEELGDTGKLLPDPKFDPQATIEELVTTIQDWVINPEIRQLIGRACQQRAEEMFREERMIEETVKVIEKALLPTGDYVSPGFSIIQPDECFPNMIIGDVAVSGWPYLRREVPHNWYVDKRKPDVGFLNRDEAHILYNTALQFKGKKTLEIGCWLGWSACHLALAGVELDVIDPLLDIPAIKNSVSNSLQAAGVLDKVELLTGCSPQKVEELATQLQRKWSLIFIDGDHEAPGPLNDAITCEKFAEADALILFHDLASPDVAQGLEYLKQRGWQTMVYQTMQIMGVAWRGNVEPVKHQPDPKVSWYLPIHLQGYCISGSSLNSNQDEFRELLNAVRPYTLLSEARLFSLYSLAKQVCLDDIPGNFVECGTYKGGATALLASVIQRYTSRPRLVYAFDTFEGMPEPTEIDCHEGIPANLTGFGVGTLKAPIRENLDNICQSLNVRDIVVPVQGLFAQTLPQYQSDIGDIALLHADGDWYESTMEIFNFLYDNVVPGGMIQIDDYGHWEGCRKAVHDFEQQCNESFSLQIIDETGVWFRKAQSVGKSKQLSPTIVIDGVFFQLYQTGIARVWKSLLEEWSANRFAKHIVVIDRAGTTPKIPGIKYRLAPHYDYRNSDREMLQQVCDEEGANLFISTYYTAPLSTPSVFMAYDMIPEYMGWDLNHPMWVEKHNAIKHACDYIAISENTAHDLAKWFPEIPLESITIAHCGVQSTFSPASVEAISCFKNKYGITKPYFILVGAGSGYKNSILFFKAFAQLFSQQGFDILCTGSGGLLEPEFRTYTLGSTVYMLQLSDEELRVAYSGAVALIYPSKYEGFGLPVLEAMACGCPVITCPNASIPEVAGEAVIYVNDEDVDGMTNALCDVQKPDIRKSLREASIQQAQKFSWSKMAEIVSSALIDATLLPLKLKEINLIIFPDWSQSEESLAMDLEQVLRAIALHPDKSKMTLLIDTSRLYEEDAHLILSGVAMNLLMQEDLDITEGLEISLVGMLGEIQWQALLPRIRARIILENENQQAVTQAKAEALQVYELDSLRNQRFELVLPTLNHVLFQQAKWQEAIDYYQKFIENQTGTPELYWCLSECFKHLNLPEDASSILQQGIQLYETPGNFYFTATINLQLNNYIDEAIYCANAASQVLPIDYTFQLLKNLLLPIIYKNPDEISIHRQRFIEGLQELIEQTNLETPEDQKNTLAGISRFTNFYLSYQNQNDKELLSQYGTLVHQIMAANYPNWITPLSMPPLKDNQKIRIGYISNYFHAYSGTLWLTGWLRYCDKEKFEIYCYYIGDYIDPVTQQFQNYSDVFHHFPHALEATCEQIIADQLHILVFPEIGMNPQTLQIAALQLSPVQCVAWGHPVTSGLPTIDYFLSSELMEPENGQDHYSETLIRLPNIGVSYPKPYIPPVTKTRADFQLREDAVIYLCCQAPFKYLPQYDFVFAEIARRVPNAQFLFLRGDLLKPRLDTAFAAAGLNSEDYCVFRTIPERLDYLMINLLSDVYLDTFSWSGGNTTLEAIACNLPIVTCPGEFMRTRHSDSFLKMLGVTDTIGQNEAEYIEIAVKLGLDPAWRHDIAQRMSERHDYLYDDKACIGGLEAFYKQVVQDNLARDQHS
jgi:predicted O-linked N-acetylglucosamine transferase (SPINDLY family)/glycogen synthase/predicted O-methyltransferase YrrM